MSQRTRGWLTYGSKPQPWQSFLMQYLRAYILRAKSSDPYQESIGLCDGVFQRTTAENSGRYTGKDAGSACGPMLSLPDRKLAVDRQFVFGEAIRRSGPVDYWWAGTPMRSDCVQALRKHSLSKFARAAVRSPSPQIGRGKTGVVDCTTLNNLQPLPRSTRPRPPLVWILEAQKASEQIPFQFSYTRRQP